MIPMANPSPSRHIGRKKTDHEAEQAKGVSASENVHASFAIARFPRFKTLHPGEAFHEIFCARLHYRRASGFAIGIEVA
jgi:hypothetical protein